MRKELKLIQIYMYICDLYDSEQKYYCQRYSNNSKPSFTGQKITTVYLFVAHCQKYFLFKEILFFVKEYILLRFPEFPSCQTLNCRLNLLLEAFKVLSMKLTDSFKPVACDMNTSLVDSMPVITCGGRNRRGKAAPEITYKGFCSTKNQYYYGLKLHALAFRHRGTVPFPDSLILAPAEEKDLTVFKQVWGENIRNRTVCGDNIYSDFEYFNKEKKQKQNMEMLTPVKTVKGSVRNRKTAYKCINDLFFTAVSRIRQPIESFFNWLNEKTTVQRAQKVRSTAGLLIHTMGKMAVAFIYLIF